MTARKLGFIVRVVLTVALCAALVSFLSIQVRYTAALIGLVPTPQADAYELDDNAFGAQSDGPHTISAQYCSEIVAQNDPSNSSGLTSTELTFDNAWFAKDSRTYNHKLATACAVLSAVCNSESHFYGSVEGSVPYAEETLHALGFDNIQTDSYRLRSHVLDQIGAFFAGSHDVAAYAFASKTIPGKNGAADQTLVFVGIRGSYGTEWLSNFKLVGEGESGSDHWGFKAAETEIMEALQRYTQEIGADSETTKVLVTGHSRGGAIANLLAADLNRGGSGLVDTENVFAYTFASPGSTQVAERESAAYDNIFNVVNASDIVPQLPLFSWNFGRYGTTVQLPDVNEADFSRSYESMQVRYQSNTGYTNPCDTAALGTLDTFDSTTSRTLPTLESLTNPQGVFAAIQALAGIDYGMALSAHYPDTYIAWMQSVQARDLSFL